MKRRCFFILAIALLACQSHEEKTTAADTSGTDTISTSGTQTSGTVSRTSTGSSGGTASSLNAEDKEFFMKAVQGSQAEVSLGHMAAEKATSDSVKNFANRMVSDHGKWTDELTQLAKTKGVALPAVLAKGDAKTGKELSNKVGRDFDKSYMDEMIRDHEKDVHEFQKASIETTDPDLKAWAVRNLQTLQDHLKMAKEVAARLK